MERTELFDLMGELKLYGMKDAFDEIMAAESGATRTPIPAQGGQHSGDCGQPVMAA